jgi:hypothetical protein
MVIYFVEVDDGDTLTKLNNSVAGIDRVEFQGVLRDYRNENGKQVALFHVYMGKPQLNFKMKYPNSSQRYPSNLPAEVKAFFGTCN